MLENVTKSPKTTTLGVFPFAAAVLYLANQYGLLHIDGAWLNTIIGIANAIAAGGLFAAKDP